MKQFALVALLGCTLALGACSSIAGGVPSGVPAAAGAVLGNLSHCDRQYIASVGGLGVPGGSLSINCKAQPWSAPAAAEVPAAPAE